MLFLMPNGLSMLVVQLNEVYFMDTYLLMFNLLMCLTVIVKCVDVCAFWVLNSKHLYVQVIWISSEFQTLASQV